MSYEEIRGCFSNGITTMASPWVAYGHDVKGQGQKLYIGAHLDMWILRRDKCIGTVALQALDNAFGVISTT